MSSGDKKKKAKAKAKAKAAANGASPPLKLAVSKEPASPAPVKVAAPVEAPVKTPAKAATKAATPRKAPRKAPATPRKPATAKASGTFDRVRPRTTAPDEIERAEISTALPSIDADGKRRLFSTTSASPVMGAVTLECSSCSVESTMTVAQLLRASIPSVHLPLLKRRFPSYLRCPSCGKRTWMHPHFRV